MFSVDGLKQSGFGGFLSVADLKANHCDCVPKRRGIYAAVRISNEEPMFRSTSVGGHFKGKDPTVDEGILKGKWIEEASVIYLGKAGDPGKSATLCSRLKQLMSFGSGNPVGHWGGRLLWQLEDSEELVVAWKETDNPSGAEARLLEDFRSLHGGRMPFANLR